MRERDPLKHHYRLKRPCSNCPFLKEGAIELAPGRLHGIIEQLTSDDHSTFPCHKTVGMRLAFVSGAASPSDWDDVQSLVTD